MGHWLIPLFLRTREMERQDAGPARRCDNGARPPSAEVRTATCMNLPNSITMSRIVMIPLLLWILTPHFPWHGHGAQEITASVLFVLASITDGLDGYLARKRKQITTMGMLLDPHRRQDHGHRRADRPGGLQPRRWSRSGSW